MGQRTADFCGNVGHDHDPELRPITVSSVCLLLFCLDMLIVKAQWHMEQAAMKSGAMAPDGRPRAGVGTHPDDDEPEGARDSLGTTTQHSGGGKDSFFGGGIDGSGGGATSAIGGGGLPAGGEMPNGDSLEQIYQSTRMWCRTLRRSPNAMEALIAFARTNPRSQSGIIFNQYLSDFTGIMYRRLSTTVEEEVRTIGSKGVRFPLRAIHWHEARL